MIIMREHHNVLGLVELGPAGFALAGLGLGGLGSGALALIRLDVVGLRRVGLGLRGAGNPTPYRRRGVYPLWFATRLPKFRIMSGLVFKSFSGRLYF